MNDLERAHWWQKQYREKAAEADYYRQQLSDAHALIGRIVHQFSERWDSVNIGRHFPTDNLHHWRQTGNAKGTRAEAERLEAGG